MSRMFQPPPQPATELGRLRILSRSAGIRVSPLQLGAASIGQAWSSDLGSMDKKTSFELLDAFYEAGGNMIDTANAYQDEESEMWIGEWMKERQNRDDLVIATKFSSDYKSYKTGKGPRAANHVGNSKRSLYMSLRDSLEKLQTAWVDVLYVHWWDWTTSIEELMDSLHTVVQSGKVLYLGASDTPAYIVAAANTYARDHGKTPFSIYQGRWNIMLRDLEREILPMCRQFGMAIAPWDVLGGGKFQTKAQLEERQRNNEGLRSLLGAGQTEEEAQISEALYQVAQEHGLESPTTIALAYVMSRAPHVFPIVGGRKVSHLNENIKALSIQLTNKQIAYLQSIVPFKPGFPYDIIGEDQAYSDNLGMLVGATAHLSFVKGPQPISHAQA